MPRRKKASAVTTEEAVAPPMESMSATAVLEPSPELDETPSAQPDAAPAMEERKYANPYRAVFTSTEGGFELGENFRFKQRVFSFDQKPADHVIATLKESGFTYRPAEKSWTIPATAENRVLTDRLASEFAGQQYAASR